MTLEAVVLLGYGGFLAYAFGWRSGRLREVLGSSPWRRPVSAVDAVGETLCVAGCAGTLLAPVLSIAGVVDPVWTGWPVARGLVGAAGVALGAAVALAAQRGLAAQFRFGVEASAVLVTSGWYARVRNPFYSGWVLAAAGVAVAVPSVPAAAGLVLHLVAAEILVRRVEEPLLLAAHGASFRRYVERSGRFLPRRGG